MTTEEFHNLLLENSEIAKEYFYSLNSDEGRALWESILLNPKSKRLVIKWANDRDFTQHLRDLYYA